MSIFKKLFRFFLLLTCLNASAGNPFDTTYIKPFKQNYVFQADLYNKKLFFSINPYSHVDSIDSRIVKYKPNVDNYFGASLSYKGWGLGFSVKVPNSRLSDSLYGKTTFQDYKFSIHKRKFGGSAFVKYYQGFYLDNPALFDTTWKSGAVPQRSDMNLGIIGLNGYYLINNKHFSMQSLFSQSEKQLKTASTFLLQGDAFFSFLESDSSLIPKSDQNYYQDMKGFEDMYMYSFSLMGGYAHCNVISENYYICPMIYAGPGYQHKYLNTDNGVLLKNNLFLKTNFKFAAGYNADVAYLGMLLDVDTSLMPSKFINMKTTVITLNFFVGYRFW